MVKGYRIIFWGVFFATFHIDIGWLQIIPSFIAWLIISKGVKCIYREYSTDNLRNAKNFARIAAILCVSSLLYYLLSGDAQSSNPITDAFLTLAFSVSELLFGYKILSGSTEYLLYNEKIEEANSCIIQLRCYLIAFLFFLCIMSIYLFFYLKGFGTLVAIIGILLRIWFMVMIRSLRKGVTEKRLI